MSKNTQVILAGPKEKVHFDSLNPHDCFMSTALSGVDEVFMKIERGDPNADSICISDGKCHRFTNIPTEKRWVVPVKVVINVSY